MFNTIMIILISSLALLGGIFWMKRTSSVPLMEEDEDPYSIEHLTQYVNHTFQTTLRRSLKDMNLSREELEREERIKRELRTSLRAAAIGDQKAKRFIKASIIGIICNLRRANTITEDTADQVIPFHDSTNMSVKDKFETMLYIYENKILDDNGRRYGADGLSKLFKEYGFTRPLPGSNNYIVTADQICEAYENVIQEHPISFNDKKEIISQRIFEDLEGFGPVDMLLETSIDEVQGGVSGIPMDSYEFRREDINQETVKHSYDSIWIVMSGLTIHLDFLSFGSQKELVRVCQNIYKYDAPNVLSRTDGKVVATMKDGSRIVVVRPPFADSYAFIARKFDSAPSISPEDLLRDSGKNIPILMMKWLIKGCRNIAITGDQGTGKTTMLKSFIRFIREDYPLRIQELTPELNIRYAYSSRNVLSFRETDSISSQEGLNLQKKTSGTVNIIGEVATAEAASWIIQTAKVASKMTMFTHHAKTVMDLIVSLRNNLMQVNNYTNDASVDEMIATALNIDVHLERKKGHRYIGRITEIIPIRDRSYPCQDFSDTTDIDRLNRANIINENEYRKRMTDRILFTYRDLVVFNEDKNCYELVNMPTQETLTEIKEALTREEEAEMSEDFKVLSSFFEKKVS